MPESNKRAIASPGRLVVLVACFVGLAVTIGVLANLLLDKYEHTKEREAAAAYQTQSARGEIQATCVQQPRSRTYRCTADVPVADQHDPYAEYDLRAQQDMARYAFAVALISLGSLFLTGVALVLLWWTLEATREAVGATVSANVGFMEASKRELRAYVHVTDVVVEDMKDGGAPRITYVIQNYGATPARDVEAKSLVMGCPDPTRRKFAIRGDRGSGAPRAIWGRVRKETRVSRRKSKWTQV